MRLPSSSPVAARTDPEHMRIQAAISPSWHYLIAEWQYSNCITREFNRQSIPSFSEESHEPKDRIYQRGSSSTDLL